MKQKIAIINYGAGNLRSVEKAFQKFDTEVKIIDNPLDLEQFDKLVLPGVGYFKTCMKQLIGNGFVEVLNDLVILKKIPILGICLGMQLMTEWSEEGDFNGLGWIKGKSIKFDFHDKQLKIPHMGWNQLLDIRSNSILKDINFEDEFYFVHSYHVTNIETKNILAKTIYGNEFVSAFQKNNIIATQFHPEKSHTAGLKIIQNFIEGTCLDQE